MMSSDENTTSTELCDILVIPVNRPGITVQPFVRHPMNPTAFLWVHNVLEPGPSALKVFDYKPKPPGWGNPGGGMETNELELLASLFPDHWLLRDTKLDELSKNILACGIRETVHESGYRDIRIVTDYPGLSLIDYSYKPEPPEIVGHRKVTLWAELDSLVAHEIVEKHEIDRVEWIDMSESIFRIFWDRRRFPDRPYWSHVRGDVIAISRIYRYLRFTSEHGVEDIHRMIHPSWRTVFPIGKGDSRFPPNGFRMSPTQWYKLFDWAIANRIEDVDEDVVYRFFRKEIEDIIREMLEWAGKPSTQQAMPEPMVVESSEDRTSIPTPEEIARQQDEEYARAIEDALEDDGLPAHLRVTKRIPVL